MYRVEVLDARSFSPSDARAIAELLVLVWPKPGKTVDFRQQQMLEMAKGYSASDEHTPVSMVIREGERVIAHAAMIPRMIRTEAGDMTVAGLSRVCSNPSFRGKGLGELVVREIFALVDRSVFPFSLFQTSNAVRPFYERLGAVEAKNRFVDSLAEDSTSNPFWDEVAMRYPKEREWPAGEIDLRGPGF